MADPVYLTINEFPGTGAPAPTVVDFAFAGGYISPAHVKAELFDPVTYLRTPVTVTDEHFVTDYRLSLPVSVPVGSVLRVYRDTPKDQPLVDFTNGARIAENNLDLVAEQAVFVAAEAADQIAATQIADVLQAVSASATNAVVAQVAAAASAASAALSEEAAQDGASVAGAFAVAASGSAAAAAASAVAASGSAAAAAASAQDAADEATAVRTDLASAGAGKGAELVAFKTRSVAAKFGDQPTAFDNMTPAQIADVKSRSLLVDVSAPIAAALAANKTLTFDAGSYYLGEYNSSSDLIFQLHNDRWDLRANGDVEFVVRTATGTGGCFPVVFDLKAASGSSFGKFRFRDLGYDDSTSNRRGLKAYRLSADSASGSWGAVSIERIQCTNCISPISFEGADSANRVRGVHINEIDLENCYYGPLAQNQGDNFTVDVLRGNLVRRIYFVYGCKTHDVCIIDRNPKGSTGTINISRADGGFDTEDLRVTYSCREASTVNQLYANINHIDLLGGAIRGIRLHLDIDVPVTAVPLRFINYDGSGVQTTAASPNIVDDVVVSGRFGSTSAVIDTFASYGSRGDLEITARNAVVGAGTRSAFLLENDAGTWTPVLADDSLSAAEGQTASVSVGTYSKRGNVVHFTGRIRMTSLGSLNTTQTATILGLPYTSENVSNRIGSVHCGYAANLNLSAVSTVCGYVPQNASRITLQKWSATTGVTGVTVGEISADGEIAFSGEYTVA